jgi:hypothetical protein
LPQQHNDYRFLQFFRKHEAPENHYSIFTITDLDNFLIGGSLLLLLHQFGVAFIREQEQFHGKDEVISSTLIEGSIFSIVVGFDATGN